MARTNNKMVGTFIKIIRTIQKMVGTNIKIVRTIQKMVGTYPTIRSLRQAFAEWTTN